MQRYVRVSALTMLLVFFVLTGSGHNVYGEQTEMDVHFIDVGQGDSILIQTPSDKNILIDGGPPEAGKKVVGFLEDHNVEKIDLLIATHPDIDHIGGLTHVMKSFEVDRIIDSGKLYSTKTYAKYISQILKQRIPIEIAKQNALIQIDPFFKVRILNTHTGNKDNNDSSIALKISFKEIDFLLMGDVEKEQEKKLSKKYNLQSEIIKVAHHGSNTSTTSDFLDKVNPELAILTYSKKNDYGHPVDRVIENLINVNAAIYSTAIFGDITISTDGESYLIETEKHPTSNLNTG
ncbi:Metal-dependent hydrolase, beta-lactamase superfamily II [Virgibacillus subterraneus]|uniref:Metal-dependent hydrolase, beta-lactamase superfamily II n=1 Tax=Virgibacillus subterraneus TaxID=621109 RepID=A0A1H9L0B5_9BACI|nr:ComEC/Rec2 family competence protein [Virgibacillus subterraneus]SER04820.1 Metal-dependent hydrolase, beta-lactamase superfamily II [Virgibacillus subterraneus]